MMSGNSVVDLCREFVRIPGLSGQEGDLARKVTQVMGEFCFDEIATDDYGNVLGIVRGLQPGPAMLFDAHMDTVPAAGGGEWQHVPFAAEVSNGRLWGLGAADTRSALAAMLWAVGHLDRQALHGQVMIAASVCEENMTGAALDAVLARYPVDMLVTGEPTGLRLGVAQKGRATILLTAHGRCAHTSVPESGENAVYKMMAVVQRLRALPLAADPDLGPAFLVLTEIISEPYPNGLSVPHGCRARLVGRTLPGETPQSLLHTLQSALDGLSGVEMEFAELRQVCYTGRELVMQDFLPGWRSASDSPWQERLLAALSRARLSAERWYAPCGTNASAAAERGIPAFIYGPGHLEQAHQMDEWVALEEIIAAARGYAAIVMAASF